MSDYLDSKISSSGLGPFLKTQAINKLGNLKDKRILEMGGGENSIFEDASLLNFEKPLEILSCDIKPRLESSVLYNGLPDIPSDGVNYLRIDLCEKFPHGKFDLVVDAHMIHCITSEEKRKKLFKNIYHSLAPNGILAGEMMCYHKNLKVDLPYYFEKENYVLNILDGNHFIPIRKIKHHLDIEKEILENGFVIDFFIFIRGRKFSFNDNEPNALVTDPDALWYVARKK